MRLDFRNLKDRAIIDSHYSNPGSAPGLGSELVTNGDFSSGTGTDADDWTEGTGTTRVDAGGGSYVMRFAATIDNTTQVNVFLGQPHGTYRVSFTISNYSAGTFRVRAGGIATTAQGANGTYTEDISFAGANNSVVLDAYTGPFSGDVDNVSVKQVL